MGAGLCWCEHVERQTVLAHRVLHEERTGDLDRSVSEGRSVAHTVPSLCRLGSLFVFPAKRIRVDGATIDQQPDEALPATFADATLLIDDVPLSNRPYITVF